MNTVQPRESDAVVIAERINLLRVVDTGHSLVHMYAESRGVSNVTALQAIRKKLWRLWVEGVTNTVADGITIIEELVLGDSQ